MAQVASCISLMQKHYILSEVRHAGSAYQKICSTNSIEATTASMYECDKGEDQLFNTQSNSSNGMISCFIFYLYELWNIRDEIPL